MKVKKNSLNNASKGPINGNLFQNYNFRNFLQRVIFDLPRNNITIVEGNAGNGNTKSPVYFGKGMLNQLETVKTTNPQFAQSFRDKTKDTIQTITIDCKENLQFFTFYLFFPPGIWPPLYDRFNIKFNLEFTPKGNIYQLFSLVSASEKSPTEVQFFQKVQCIKLSANQMVNMDQRVTDVLAALNDNKYSSLDKVNITNIKNEVFRLAKTNCVSGGQTFSQIPRSDDEQKKFTAINFDLYSNMGNNPTPSSIMLSNEDEVLYNETDETTHIFFKTGADNVKRLFIIDAGSKYLMNSIDKLMKFSGSERVQIEIFMTHFHSDHVQALAYFLKVNYNNPKVQKITIHLHPISSVQFSGWLLENFSDVIDPNTRRLVFDLDVNPNPVNLGGMNATPNADASANNSVMAHFIHSVNWIFEDTTPQSTYCTKVFTGDFNPPPVPSVVFNGSDEFTTYFNSITNKINQKDRCKFIFFDFGHFDNKYKTTHNSNASNADLDAKFRSLFFPQGQTSPNAYIIYEHYKTINRFDVRKLYLKEFTSEHFIVKRQNRRKKKF